MNNSNEKKGLYISIIGSSLFGILGVTFAIITSSQAVLLDGAFNLVSAAMGILGLKIALSLKTPETQRFPVGFYTLEPLFVLGKGLILLLLTSYVIINNIIILMSGGSELNLGLILIYLSVALAGNIIVFALVRKKNAQSSSPILEIEKENWKVNAMITGGIAVAILFGFLFQNSFLKDYIKYADQVIVIAVALISISVPIKAIKDGLGELLLFAPAEELRKKVGDIVQKEMTAYKSIDFKNLVMLKTGRKIWLSIFIYSQQATISTNLPDQIKENVSGSLIKEFPEVNVDVIVSDQ